MGPYASFRGEGMLDFVGPEKPAFASDPVQRRLHLEL